MLEDTAKSYSMPMGESSLLESSEAMLMPPKKARIDYVIENYMDQCNQDMCRQDKHANHPIYYRMCITFFSH